MLSVMKLRIKGIEFRKTFIENESTEKSQGVMQAMLQMKKIIVADSEKAAERN